MPWALANTLRLIANRGFQISDRWDPCNSSPTAVMRLILGGSWGNDPSCHLESLPDLRDVKFRITLNSSFVMIMQSKCSPHGLVKRMAAATMAAVLAQAVALGITR